jgi:hypothetical protein
MVAKKTSLLSFFLFFTAVQSPTLLWCSEYANDLAFEDDFTDYDLGSGPLRAHCSFADVLVPAAQECGIVNILKENFYCKTHPLNHRSLLDEPLLHSSRAEDHKWQLTLSLFYNQTTKAFFDQQCDTIAAYLAFENESLISKIAKTFNNIMTQEDCRSVFIDIMNLDPSVFDINVAQVASAFGNATIQDRRFGFLFEAQKNKDRWTLGAKIPLYYLERNFFLTDNEQQELQDTGIFPEGSRDQSLQFAREHLIGDKAGLGDTRVSLAYNIIQDANIHLFGGGYLTVPTAFALQKGLFGSEFFKCAPDPDFDVCNLANIDADATFKNFGKDFINKISSHVLEQPLGNSGHLGLGLFCEQRCHWHYVSWYNYGSFEFLFPGSEKRLFVKKVNLTAFDNRNFSSDDEEIAENNLRFLKDRVFDMLFPQCLNTYVQPGPIVIARSIIACPIQQWHFKAGSDFWFQGKEHLKFMDITKGDLSKFSLSKGIKQNAYQLKILGGVSYTLNKANRDWVVSLNGDNTLASSGIGKDFMITVRLDVTW